MKLAFMRDMFFCFETTFSFKYYSVSGRIILEAAGKNSPNFLSSAAIDIQPRHYLCRKYLFYFFNQTSH